MAKKEKSVADRFKEMLERAEKRDSYHIEAAKFEVSEQVYVAMQEIGMSEAELSRRLGVSRAYVNKVLKGAANLTIESLVKIGRALDREFRFEFASERSTAKPRSARTRARGKSLVKLSPASR